MSDRVNNLMNSKCEKDYKDRHYWQKMGIDRDKLGVRYLIWRCSQCDKCIAEPLEFLSHNMTNADKETK